MNNKISQKPPCRDPSPNSGSEECGVLSALAIIIGLCVLGVIRSGLTLDMCDAQHDKYASQCTLMGFRECPKTLDGTEISNECKSLVTIWIKDPEKCPFDLKNGNCTLTLNTNVIKGPVYPLYAGNVGIRDFINTTCYMLGPEIYTDISYHVFVRELSKSKS